MATQIPSTSPTVVDPDAPTPFPTLFHPVNSKDLAWSFLFYLVGGILLLLIYACLRRNKFLYSHIYYPRRRHKPKQTPLEPPRFHGLKWFLYLCKSKNDTNILKYIGLDAYVLIRLCRYAIILFSFQSIGVLTLSPIYYRLGENELDGYIERMSLGNVVAGQTGVFCIALVFVYIYTIFGMWLLQREYILFVKNRHDFMLSRATNTCTILVERVPDNLASKIALKRYFESVIGDVLAIEIVPAKDSITELEKAVHERENILLRLERAKLEAERTKTKQHHVVFNDGTNERKKNGCGSSCCSSFLSSALCCKGWCCVKLANGEVVDSVLYYSQKLDDLNRVIPGLQNEIVDGIEQKNKKYESPVKTTSSKFRIPRRNSDLFATQMDDLEEAVWLLDETVHPSPSKGPQVHAFITFRTKAASTISSAMPLNQVDEVMRISAAMEPRDIIWNNLGWNNYVKTILFVVVLTLVVLFMFLFGGLTALIAAGTNLNNLRANNANIDEFLKNNEWMVVFMEQIGPLLLVIVFALVPPVLGLILSIQRYVAWSDMEQSFYTHFYVFQVIQVFIFYQVSGSLISIVGIGYKDPWELLSLLAETVPNNSIFFMQYLLVRALWIMPIELNRVSDLTIAFLVRPIFCGIAKTKRERRDNTCGCYTIDHPPDPWLSKTNSQIMLIVTVGIVYAVLAPMISPIAVGFGASTLLVYRNQLQFVYIADFETGGELWPQIARCIVFSFLLMHLTMIGYFALSKEPIPAALVFPLGIVTFLFGRYLNDNYTGSLPLSLARSIDIKSIMTERRTSNKRNVDKHDPSSTSSGASPDTNVSSYKHPLLLARATENPEDQTEHIFVENNDVVIW